MTTKTKTKTAKREEDRRSEQQAAAQFESIAEMVKALTDAGNDDKAREDAEQRIHEDPLSVEVRTGWYAPGSRDGTQKPAEFMILLCTGGPACRIIGDLFEHGEPESARIEHQDWFTPWADWSMSGEQQEVVLTYCRQFYFGD